MIIFTLRFFRYGLEENVRERGQAAMSLYILADRGGLNHSDQIILFSLLSLIQGHTLLIIKNWL
jgi:hypothetical protein